MRNFWNVLFLECAFFEIWYKWNVSFLECDLYGKCHFWIVLFLECVFNWMWQKMECYKIDWDKVDLWMYNLLSFFIILWVEPSTFYVSNHLEKVFLCHSWELFYLFTFAAIYSQLQATKKKIHWKNLKFIEKRNPSLWNVKPVKPIKVHIFWEGYNHRRFFPM